ncbi:hypothetical protein C2857_006294 [Epichloe festucae Fl1]|uniref:YCII-related domain-containing protein n=1 Tax=Epichloe festucae (strain Fl1) TaxID=877507 RepID=A0A7S9PW05_EPIFF|nr:hypothetical protein C2857_006294 [Epichloe festucae Fl1]
MFNPLSRSLVLRRKLLISVTQQTRLASTKSNEARRLEFFVNVWDKTGADRSVLADETDVPSRFHLLGEILDKSTLGVQGNCLACVGESEQEVLKLLEVTPYYKQGIWDMSTVKISALETVHSSDLLRDGGED